MFRILHSLLDPECVMQAAERDAETRAIGAENLKAQKDATDEARRSLLRPVVTKSQRVGILSKI